jgi:hypothetical protein
MNEKIIQNTPNVYYNKALIKQPSNIASSTSRLVVDSRERNMTIFPSPNTYEISFIENIFNVSSIRLLSADIPFDTYIVNGGNSTIYIAYNNNVYSAVVDVGDYTPTDLATKLTLSINSATSTSDFTVTYVSITDNFKFSCVNPFGLVFRGNQFRHPYRDTTDTAPVSKSMGQLLGFGINNYISTNVSGSNVITSEFKRNFDPDNTIVVNIDELGVNISTSDILDGSFAVITKNNIAQLHEKVISKTFNPPISKFNKLKISLTDYYGNPYDFQNRDHRFEFLVICD